MDNLLRKKIFRWVKVLVLIYSIIGIVLYYLQDTFLFHPEPLPRNYQFSFNVPFKEKEIAFNDTDTLNMVQFLPADSVSKGVVLYYHGNKQNIERYSKFAENFTKHGYEVWMEDYPGFGKSTGEITEQKLRSQALQVYKMAIGRFKPEQVIVYGKSFGTGVAAYVASATNCQQLILETPYSSIPDLFSCYAPIYPTNRMAKYKLPVDEFLQEATMPVTIFHGTDDGVIPYRCAAKLKSSLKPTDLFITIQNGTHHNLNDFKEFHQKLDSLLK